MTRTRNGKPRAIDYEQVFADFPVGLAVGRNRVIAACNREFLQTFRCGEGTLVGRAFADLYPSTQHYESTGARVARLLARSGKYADDRVMRRLDGELFWIHVRGFTYTPH